MGKLALLSVLVASVALPALFARDSDALRGLRRMLVGLVFFVIAYWMGVQLFAPEV